MCACNDRKRDASVEAYTSFLDKWKAADTDVPLLVTTREEYPGTFRLDKPVFEGEMNTGKLKDKLWRKIFNVPYSYIDMLLDRSRGWAMRDDYATFMIDYDEPEVEEALFRVASDPTEDDDMAESCGEAVAEIWCRKGTLKIDALRKLNAAALEEALGIIKVRQPEWVSVLQREGLMNYEEEFLSG